jgi:S1-C subfamily serine protease
VADHHATLRRRSGSYVLSAEPECPIWINGERVLERLLEPGDLIEVGRDGPILRYRLYPSGTRMTKSLREAFEDGFTGARLGSGSSSTRVVRGMAGTVRELATQTTLLFRLAVVAVIAVLLASSVMLIVRSRRLEDRLARGELRVAGLASLLEENNRRLSAETIEEVRDELSATRKRLEVLEARRDAAARVVAAAAQSVLLIQGSYGFVDAESGAALRFLGLDADGLPLRSRSGDPLVAVDGEGPPVEAQFLGTAFVVAEDGLLVTNRHVALPWLYDSDAQLVITQGLQPRMRRLIGYLPDVASPFEASFVQAAEDSDLAVLWAPGVGGRVPALTLRPTASQAGEEVIVLGYPAGIRALLARSEEAFLAELMKQPAMSFWEIAKRLAEAGQIGPLASRGIVAQVSPTAVVYDAETTRGGSGGPVLDFDGRVIAITSAVVFEFGGSNIGVPAEHGIELILRSGFARRAPWRVK